MIPTPPIHSAHPVLLNPRLRSAQAEAVSVPFNFRPRDYQTEHLFRQLFPHHYADLRDAGVQRKLHICEVWHRRAGKDKGLINAITLAAWEEVGNYLYLLPEQTQAKKIIWRGIDGNGFRFLDHIPDAICKGGSRGKYTSEMLCELKNGSTIQFGGSDNYDSWMGTNPIGIVFSEYSLQDPLARQYFRPILAENGGWEVLNFTARGKNHGYQVAEIAKANPKTWHFSLLTIEDTKREDGSPVVTRSQYEEEIANGMHEAIARQEFYCDFEAALVGSYYGDLIEKAEKDRPSRIGFFPHDPAKPVYTFWDIGLDANAAWFVQEDSGGNPVIIDYYEAVNQKFSVTLKNILQKPYVYGDHYGPHDFENRDSEGEKQRVNTADDLGVEFVRTPRTSRDDGIEAVRQLLPRCRFHEVERDVDEGHGTTRGLDCLRSYERKWDQKLLRFMDTPIHNWASHGADAFRVLAANWQSGMGNESWFDKPLPRPQNDLR